MGAKTWMIVYSTADIPSALGSRPDLDRAASTSLAKRLFPSHGLKPLEDGTLSSTCPPDGEVVVACFPRVSIVASAEFGIDHPSKLPEQFREPAGAGTVHLHVMHSVVDWLAFAVWRGGALQRSLSVSPDHGIVEDIGSRLPFEEPFWEGAHPAVDPHEEEERYPLPFHPLELGEAALASFFGYHLEGEIDPTLFDPEDVSVMRFKRSKPW
jgi:Family of unknown function (DUF6928)